MSANWSQIRIDLELGEEQVINPGGETAALRHAAMIALGGERSGGRR